MESKLIIKFVMVFIAFILVFGIFTINFAEFGADYTENSTYQETFERGEGLFSGMRIFIIALSILLLAVVIFAVLRLLVKNTSGGYY